MVIKSIELANYRNYDSLEMNFSKGTNILYGDNAQGKTNILEAIYVAATTKSHKGSKDKDIIQFEHEEAHIRTYLEKELIETRVDMHLRKNKSKGIAIDGQKIKKASQLIGLCNVVFFSPEDLSIIKNGPSERRRFIDMELCQLDQSYLHYLNQYNIMGVSIGSKFDLRRICKTLNATALVRVGPPTAEEIGECSAIDVQEVGGKKVIVIRQEGKGRVATVVIRGSTENLMEDVERVVGK